ncbi:MAG TPA: two-component regulator propeller domain-containing protein [Bryobacteraceae bacterium]|nr:two-component regulator propeller domain-containing protein [Bryobacteraceae bacterium]
MVQRVVIILCLLAAGCRCGFALNPALEISQYAHNAWTVSNGFSLGNVYAIAQTPDGYLWLGSEFGLFRFDGVHSMPWTPPAGQRLSAREINCLLVSRDGTLWIGTFAGLASWSEGKLTQHPELGRDFISSLFESRNGTVWAATLETPTGRLCAIRRGRTQCYREDGAFGRAIWAFYEDNSGALWAAAQSGLWRWTPGPPRRYATRTELIGLGKADDGRLLIAMHGAGLSQFSGDKVEPYPIRSTADPNRPLRDREVDSNRLLQDRDGGLWIGSVERGLIHLHHGRTDVFTRSDGLSGDVILALFEDREGNIWVATTGGLDRFRQLPVSTISVKQGLSSDATQSVLAVTDGSVLIGAHDGLTMWKDGQTTIFRKANGLPDDQPQSLFQDDRGRIWVSTSYGLAYFADGRFVAVNAVAGGDVHYIAGDSAGNLWLSEDRKFVHLQDGRLVEQIPWSELGRQQSAELLLWDRKRGGLWLGFWREGGVSYFKDGQLRASYTSADGLGEGEIGDLHFDRDGALWVATGFGGLSRIKDGRIATLTTKNGLPCNRIHWAIEDDDRSLWLYTFCGLVRIKRTELDSWIADPKHRIATTAWDASDGVRLRSSAASAYGPRVAKSTDGKLWFVTGEGIQVVDPRHLAFNNIPPPVHIEKITADRKTFYPVRGQRLPALTRDLEVDYTAVSLVAPEKNRFKYKLEGYDPDWIDVGNRRQAFYTNLAPRNYRFRLMASNNSGVWNEAGDSLDFSIDPAYYQTNWFRALCTTVLLALLWMAYQLRVRQLHHQFDMTVEARVGERTRIARELHDSLLQTVQGLMLSLQAVSEMMPAGAAKNKFEKTLEIGDRAIREGRHAVQDLRSASTTGDLTQAIRALGDELASGDGATFRLVVEGPMRELHPIVRDDIYSIAREALRNAFTHACATRIEAEIDFNDRLLELRIRDDGKGLTGDVTDQGRTGHYGLPGMRERARQIGSNLVILSGPETGTDVELSVPGSKAYVKKHGRFRFTFFRRNGRVRL